MIAELQALAAGEGASRAAAPPAPAVEEIEAPVTEKDGFPVAKELLDEVEGATAAGKWAATDD